MPIDYRVNHELHVVFGRAYGIVSGEDLIKFARNLSDDSTFDIGFSFLFDMQAVGNLTMSSDFIRRFANVRVFDEKSRRAIVAPNSLVFGMARMYQAYRDSPPEVLSIFRTKREACDWLGIPYTEEILSYEK